MAIYHHHYQRSLAERQEATTRRLERERLEAAYEAEMTIQIIVESAAIRAEWDEQTRQQRMVGKKPPLSVPECSAGSSVRRNGTNCG